MNDWGKERYCGGPSMTEIKAWRVRRRVQWVNSLRRMHEKRAGRGR